MDAIREIEMSETVGQYLRQHRTRRGSRSRPWPPTADMFWGWTAK